MEMFLEHYTKQQTVTACCSVMNLSHQQVSTQKSLIDAVSVSSSEVQTKIKDVIHTMGGSKKRKRQNEPIENGHGDNLESHAGLVHSIESSSFMQAPNEEVIHDATGGYIDQTGNHALHMAICVCCAWELLFSAMTMVSIQQIPNGHQLFPMVSHPAHVLHHG